MAAPTVLDYLHALEFRLSVGPVNFPCVLGQTGVIVFSCSAQGDRNDRRRPVRAMMALATDSVQRLSGRSRSALATPIT
jgi:hypothetical protein